MERPLPSNLGLDLVRATEASALAAGRWMGLGKPLEADQAAALAMLKALDSVQMDGRIVIGEEGRDSWHTLFSGQVVGTGNGPAVDVVADPIDGCSQVAQGHGGAIAAVAVAPRGRIWAPGPVAYMEKIVVGPEVAGALVPECLDAPPAWTLALVARVLGKQVSDLVVFVLDRRRHTDLIAEIRAAGARVMLSPDGDVAGALMATMPAGQVDILMGIGGVPEGLLAACAVKAAGGAMLGRLAPPEPGNGAAERGLSADARRIRTEAELVTDPCVFFAATGITDGPLLAGVRYHGPRAESNSIILRAETRTRRLISAEHLLGE